MLQTPVALIIFNRPALTRRVFAAVRDAQPRRLFVIGDGARTEREGESEKVEEARRIIEEVDWECEVQTHFSDVNLGCKARVSTGLDWAFDQAESLIILEDDCLPEPSFFGYCEALLHRFANDDRVMMISGDNFQPQRRSSNSYYFSRWAHIWGWASWRRAWKHFDVEIESWPAMKATGQLREMFGSEAEYQHWSNTLDRQHAGLIDTWDFPWQYACWVRQGLTILPEVNLISNLGFGDDATHTTDGQSRLANLPTHDIGSLVHPDWIAVDQEADAWTWETIFRDVGSEKSARKKSPWYRRLSNRLRGVKS